ncbi:hypothetical protein PIB30_078823 [Stylosanthes scabra]|uniref:PB1-like domain-containing protein n=1 Tax=Stylosanthes scabra TaxID=79078 RepID=A0ABU6SS66_9FABA|nr:hypothetical protein [Stylosanthes scabra]
MNFQRRQSSDSEPISFSIGGGSVETSCEGFCVIRVTMALFDIKLYHKGHFGYVDGVMRYVGGEVLLIEDNDSDFWCVFVAEASKPTKKSTTRPKAISASQPTNTSQKLTAKPSWKPSSSQPVGSRLRFCVRHVGDPHVSPNKLRQMAKLPPRAWGNL